MTYTHWQNDSGQILSLGLTMRFYPQQCKLPVFTCLTNNNRLSISCTFIKQWPPSFVFICVFLLVLYCTSDPCMNGGSCLEVLNSFTCVCSLGFTGRRCQNGRWYFPCVIAFGSEMLYFKPTRILIGISQSGGRTGSV